MVKRRSKLKIGLLFLLDSYGLILSILLLLWLITGEKLFFVNVFVNINPAIYYALPFVAFSAILLKSRRSFIFLILPILAVVILYVPRFLPRQIENLEGQELVLLAYNLHVVNHDYETLNGVLQRANADIISLEEVNHEMAAWLESEWADNYPYFVRYENDADESQYSGRFFMSRYPILSYEYVNAPSIKRLIFIRAELDVLGRNVVVYNVHLPAPRYLPLFDTTLRSNSMSQLLESASNDDSPVILMGDFNMTDISNDYRRISSAYQDSFLTTSTGLGTSWPNARFANESLGFVPSMIRIDYVFLSEEFAPQETRVLREGVSDHFPIWARVVLENPQ